MRKTDEERELERLDDELAEGRITQAEYNAEARAIARWYRNEQQARADEAAREAYAREMER